jgi:ABC transporter ATM
MLLRAARFPCSRTARYIHPSFAGRARWTSPNGIQQHKIQLRVFTSGSPWQNQSTDGKDPTSARDSTTPTGTAAELANAAIVQKAVASEAKNTSKKDMLSESAIASKEQRKADWAIMREMAKYLWPKVILQRWKYMYGIGCADRVS